MKIAIYNTFGVFSLPKDLEEKLKLCGINEGSIYSPYYNHRSNPIFIEEIEKRKLIDDEWPIFNIKIIEIPDGTNWYISDFNGRETIREGKYWE